MRQPGRPAGVPVSRALDIRPGIANDELRQAIAAVNRVHGDGVLPTIPLSFAEEIVDPRAARADGGFSFDPDNEGRLIPVSIVVRSPATNRRFLVLHETGHVLDAAGLPGAGFASIRWGGMQAWRRAVVASRAYNSLITLRAADPRRAASLLPFEELWARAYAQFVAVRSHDPTLLASLTALRRQAPDKVYYPRQWDDDDFAQIEHEIERVFRRMRWIA